MMTTPRSDLNQGIGWFEFFRPVLRTTEIAYVHESGNVHLPEATESDFVLASAAGEVFRLVRAIDIAPALDAIENTINTNDHTDQTWSNAEVLDMLLTFHGMLADSLGIHKESNDV